MRFCRRACVCQKKRVSGVSGVVKASAANAGTAQQRVPFPVVIALDLWAFRSGREHPVTP